MTPPSMRRSSLGSAAFGWFDHRCVPWLDASKPCSRRCVASSAARAGEFTAYSITGRTLLQLQDAGEGGDRTAARSLHSGVVPERWASRDVAPLDRRIEYSARPAGARTRPPRFAHPDVGRRLLPIPVIKQPRRLAEHSGDYSPPPGRTPTPWIAHALLAQKVDRDPAPSTTPTAPASFMNTGAAERKSRFSARRKSLGEVCAVRHPR